MPVCKNIGCQKKCVLKCAAGHVDLWWNVTERCFLLLLSGSRGVDVGLGRKMKTFRMKRSLSKTKDFCIIHIEKELGQVPQGGTLVSQDAGAEFQVPDLLGLQSGSKPDLFLNLFKFFFKY